MNEDWDWDRDDDVEYGEESDFEDEQETETVECTNCGADVFEDAVACPVCGEYVGVNTHHFRERPRWWITLGVLGVIATILSLVFLS